MLNFIPLSISKSSIPGQCQSFLPDPDGSPENLATYRLKTGYLTSLHPAKYIYTQYIMVEYRHQSRKGRIDDNNYWSCCRKETPFQGPKGDSCLALRNEFSKETHVLSKQEILSAKGAR